MILSSHCHTQFPRGWMSLQLFFLLLQLINISLYSSNNKFTLLYLHCMACSAKFFGGDLRLDVQKTEVLEYWLKGCRMCNSLCLHLLHCSVPLSSWNNECSGMVGVHGRLVGQSELWSPIFDTILFCPAGSRARGFAFEHHRTKD